MTAPQKRFPRWIPVLVLLLAAAGWLGYRKLKGAGEAGPRFQEHAVSTGDIDVTLLATGVVQPENRVEIKPPINGRVEQVLVNEGAEVKRGQVLAWMSSTERAALLDAARAKGAKELRKWEKMYRPTPILAPIDGTIIQRNVESGQSFTSADPVLVMGDRLTVKANVDETDIGRIRTGQKAAIVLDAYPEERIAAEVGRIAHDATTVNNVTSYVVDVIPETTPDFMRSGMTANVTFEVTSRKEVVVLPIEAVRTEDGRSVVFVKAGDRRQERPVRTGASDGKWVEVTDGIAPGEVVLVPRFRPLKDPEERGGNPFAPARPRRRGGSGGGHP